MNGKFRTQIVSGMLVLALALSGCSGTYALKGSEVKGNSSNTQEQSKQKEDKGQGGKYSIEQAMSDRAQLTTIAYSGLAFITGNSGADSFMPPGKVADFFGFQYMRDVDVAGYGHNTQFLTRVANNILYVLNDEQKALLVNLASEQADLYTSFAYNRFPMMDAFRSSLEGDIPEGSEGLNIENVGDYAAELYEIDADLSYERAVVLGYIINSFTDGQLEYLDQMEFANFNTWPDVEEDDELKQSMTHTEFVAVMTYASELFSWYKGSIEADVYFCPERHGTYFGGFFLKDYLAMNDPDYFISTSVTGNKGEMFLDILNDDQRVLIESITDEQEDALVEIAEIRTLVSTELRKAQTGETIDKELVYNLIKRYGELDGEISALYAQRFTEVNATLTDEQMQELVELRDLDVDLGDNGYMFSAPVTLPVLPATDYLFGVGDVPEDAAKYEVPQTFIDASNGSNNRGGNKKPEGEEGNRPPKPEGEEKSNDAD